MRVYWLEQSAADVPPGDVWLSPGEAARLEGMRFPKRRADWRLGRWVAKSAVAVCLHIPELREIEIRATPSGAPEVLIAGQGAPVAISLSHRDGRAICVVTQSTTALGCDLELIEPRSDAFVADFFAVQERLLVARASPSDRDRLVALIWSAKESALKALQVGLRADTREVVVDGLDIVAAPAPAWRHFHVGVDNLTCDGWWQQDGRFVRTLVGVAGPPIPIRLQTATVALFAGNHPAVT